MEKGIRKILTFVKRSIASKIFGNITGAPNENIVQNHLNPDSSWTGTEERYSPFREFTSMTKEL